MSEPERKAPAHSAGAFFSSDPKGMIVVPTRTLSDEYHDEPTEPEDSDRVPEPGPPGLVKRIVGHLGRRSNPEDDPCTASGRQSCRSGSSCWAS